MNNEINSISFKKGTKKSKINEVFKSFNVTPIKASHISQNYIWYRIHNPTKNFYSIKKPFVIVVYQEKSK
jgi:hypothetical protein